MDGHEELTLTPEVVECLCGCGSLLPWTESEAHVERQVAGFEALREVARSLGPGMQYFPLEELDRAAQEMRAGGYSKGTDTVEMPEEEKEAANALARMDAEDELRWRMGNEAYFALPDEERERRVDARLGGGFEMTIDPADPVDPSPQFRFRISPAQALRMVQNDRREGQPVVVLAKALCPHVQTRERSPRQASRRTAVSSRGDPSPRPRPDLVPQRAA